MECATCGWAPVVGADWSEVFNTGRAEPCEHWKAKRHCSSCSVEWYRIGMKPDWDVNGCAHEDCPTCVELLTAEERA